MEFAIAYPRQGSGYKRALAHRERKYFKHFHSQRQIVKSYDTETARKPSTGSLAQLHSVGIL